MKIRISIKIAMLMLCAICMVALTGCGSEKQIVGTWTITAAAINGESVDVSEIGFVEMQLLDDGTAILTTDDASVQSTWSYDNGNLIIDGITYTFETDVLTLNSDGAYIKFEKK